MCRKHKQCFRNIFIMLPFFRHFSQNREKLQLFSSRLPVCLSAWNNSASTGWLFMKFDIRVSSKICQEIFQVSLNRIRITDTSHEDQSTFFTISRSFLLRMRNVSDGSCRENQNTHYLFSNSVFGNRAVYEIIWKNVVEPDRPQMTIWRMRISRWIPRATNTHLQNM